MRLATSYSFPPDEMLSNLQEKLENDIQTIKNEIPAIGELEEKCLTLKVLSQVLIPGETEQHNGRNERNNAGTVVHGKLHCETSEYEGGRDKTIDWKFSLIFILFNVQTFMAIIFNFNIKLTEIIIYVIYY